MIIVNLCAFVMYPSVVIMMRELIHLIGGR